MIVYPLRLNYLFMRRLQRSACYPKITDRALDSNNPCVAVVAAVALAAPQQSKLIKEAADKKGPQDAKILKQINKLNDDGSYTYGYEADDGSFKVETRDKDGIVKGKYGFLDGSGQLKTIEYTAGHKTEPELDEDEIQDQNIAAQTPAVKTTTTATANNSSNDDDDANNEAEDDSEDGKADDDDGREDYGSYGSPQGVPPGFYAQGGQGGPFNGGGFGGPFSGGPQFSPNGQFSSSGQFSPNGQFIASSPGQFQGQQFSGSPVSGFQGQQFAGSPVSGIQGQQFAGGPASGLQGQQFAGGPVSGLQGQQFAGGPVSGLQGQQFSGGPVSGIQGQQFVNGVPLSALQGGQFGRRPVSTFTAQQLNGIQGQQLSGIQGQDLSDEQISSIQGQQLGGLQGQQLSAGLVGLSGGRFSGPTSTGFPIVSNSAGGSRAPLAGQRQLAGQVTADGQYVPNADVDGFSEDDDQDGFVDAFPGAQGGVPGARPTLSSDGGAGARLSASPSPSPVTRIQNNPTLTAAGPSPVSPTAFSNPQVNPALIQQQQQLQLTDDQLQTLLQFQGQGGPSQAGGRPATLQQFNPQQFQQFPGQFQQSPFPGSQGGFPIQQQQGFPQQQFSQGQVPTQFQSGSFNGQIPQQGFNQIQGGSFSPAGIQSQGGISPQFQSQNGLGGQQFAPVQNFLPGGFQGQQGQIPQQFLQQQGGIQQFSPQGVQSFSPQGAQSFSPQGAQGFNPQGAQGFNPQAVQQGSITSSGFPFDYAGPYNNIPGGVPFGGQFAGGQQGSGVSPQGQSVLAVNNGPQRVVSTAATSGGSATDQQPVTKSATGGEKKSG